MVVERGEIQGGPGSRWGLLAPEQPTRLVGPGILGDLHAVDGCGARVPGTQERVAAATGVAPLQRTETGARAGLCAGLCAVEDPGSLVQAGRTGDGDSQARSPPTKRLTQTTANDAGGH